MDDLSKALPLAERALEALSNEPESWELIFYKGLSLSLIAHCMWLTDNQAATEAARSGLTLLERINSDAQDFDPIAMVQYEAAKICNLLDETERCLQHCEICLGQSLTDEDRLSWLVIYGEALRKRGQSVESERVLKEALQMVKVDERMLPRIHFELGSTYRSAGQPMEARESFVLSFEALRSHPLRDDRLFLSDLYWNIAELCYELQHYEKAVTIFQEVFRYHSEEDGQYWNAMIWLGYCYKATGNHDKARECFQTVLKSPYSSEADKKWAREGLEQI